MIALLILGASSQALAQEDSFELAENLGDVLASEDLCGLHYDQDSIRKFIEAHVKADDMGFTPSLKAQTDARREMTWSQSEKTAHCAQISRTARAYGFTQ
jgi:hypothetical protein